MHNPGRNRRSTIRRRMYIRYMLDCDKNTVRREVAVYTSIYQERGKQSPSAKIVAHLVLISFSCSSSSSGFSLDPNFRPSLFVGVCVNVSKYCIVCSDALFVYNMFHQYCSCLYLFLSLSISLCVLHVCIYLYM